MIKLRPYQNEAVERAVRYFREENPDPALIVLPTAWGKSILTAYVAASMEIRDRLLVVQPTKELLEQNYNKFIDLCGNDGLTTAGIFSASFGKKDVGKITYATIGSIKSIGEQFKQLGFTKMLIDEAHLYPRKEESMLGQFLKDSGIRQVLGITATPLKLEQFNEKQGDRFDKWSELIMLTNPSPSGTFFKNILHVGQIQEITGLGYWSPLIYEPLPFDPKELKLNSTGGEYSEESQEMAYRLNNIRANIYAALDYHRERRHCLVFVPSVEEAAILANDYPGAAYISGDMPKKERTQTINAFKSGQIRVLFNVSVLSVGFDFPKIDMIVLAMSTVSVARYYQILGRGVRIDPEKSDCIIVDMGGNYDRFGRVEDIYFEKTDRWRMYGNNGMLLTGLPIYTIGTTTRQDINRMYSRPNYFTHFGFGKHKGKAVWETPMSYRCWVLNNQRDTVDPALVDQIRLSIENHIRDTRNDPPMSVMPDGQHAGESMGFVPRGYLAWYYHSKEWNECNDSLRRGIELFYGGIPPYYQKRKQTT